MPTEFDSNQLVETYKKTFGNMFFRILQKLLIANDAIVAGGGVLAPYDTTGKTAIHDLDIYVHERNAQSLFAQLSNIIVTPDFLFGFIPNEEYETILDLTERVNEPIETERININKPATSDNVLLEFFNFKTNQHKTKFQPPYDKSFFVKNNILLRLPMNGLGFNDESNTSNILERVNLAQHFPIISMDILVVDDNVSLISVPENFDLSFCKIWWDGKQVWATNPDDITNKTGTLSDDYISALLQGNKFTMDRILKYKNRGFKIIIPEVPQKTVVETTKKQLISDQRWVISKIIPQIKILFNLEKILEYAYKEQDSDTLLCFHYKKIEFIKNLTTENNITKYNLSIFILDALKNFNKDHQEFIFTMENINNLYVNLFEFLELDLQALKLLLNFNDQVPQFTSDIIENTNNIIQNIFIPPKEQFIEEIKTIFYKMWALQENSDNLDNFRNKNADKEIPENIKKEVLQRFFQIYILKCKISVLSTGLLKRVSNKEVGFDRYLKIINNAFSNLEETNKLDKFIMDSKFLMDEVLNNKLIPSPNNRFKFFPKCEYSPYINFLFPEYIYTKKYQDKIKDPRISYFVYKNNYCTGPIKGYFKPTPEFGGSVEPNQVFDTKDQCQEYKKQLLTEQQRRTAEARERAFAQYGDLTDPDVSGDVDDFVIPGGTYGIDEIPGKCYRAEDSGKDISKKWYEKGNILFLMHFSEIDPAQEDLTVCVSKEYLEKRMFDPTNIYYTCNGPNAEILNGDRRGKIIPIGKVRPDEIYDRLPKMGPGSAEPSNEYETFVKINIGQEILRNEKGEKTVDTTVPAYLRINDVRKIIQIINENPEKTKIFSLIPDGVRTHTITKHVYDTWEDVSGFHCQNNTFINIYKVREFVPKTNAAGEWKDLEDVILTIDSPPPQLTRQGSNIYGGILAPFTRQEEGTEITEQQRPTEDTVIDDYEVIPGQVEEQDYNPDLDNLYQRLDDLIELEISEIRTDPNVEEIPLEERIQEARFYLGKGWRDKLDEIITPYSNDDIVFLSRLRRWLDKATRTREFRFWNPEDFIADPPLEDQRGDQVAETLADEDISDTDALPARQLFADDQSIDENED